MPCVKDRRTPCPYRRRFGCADAHRDLGVSLGRCVFEVAQREHLLEEADRGLEWVPEEDRRRYAMAMARWIDAVIYARRAQTWQTIAFDRESDRPKAEQDQFGSPTALAALRYSGAATNRLVRTHQVLRPFLEQISTRRAAGMPARAMAAAKEILDRDRPGWDKPKVLDQPVEGAA